MVLFFCAYMKALSTKDCWKFAVLRTLEVQTEDELTQQLDRTNYAEGYVLVRGVGIWEVHKKRWLKSIPSDVRLVKVNTCPRCGGTGLYSGPTGWLRQGKPICFGCYGRGY